MITFISGKPGDGKSLYATKLILEDLVEDRAYVVTNVPLIPSAVHAYVSAEREKRKIEMPFSFDDSVRVLDDPDVYEFYRRRSGGLVLDSSPDFGLENPRDRLDRPEFVAKMKQNFLRIRDDVAFQRPCHYYIDEAHNFFSAREWANVGRGLLYYTSQHRHLHDNIWFITQVVDNVEKQLRGLASELHRIRNNLRRSIGPIRLRPVFKVHQFYGVPSEGATTQPYNLAEMTLDPAKVAGCYRTVGALGVQTKPEKLVNKGKLPWWTFWVLGVLAVLALGGVFLALPALGMGAAKRLAVGGTPGKAEQQQQQSLGDKAAGLLGGSSLVTPGAQTQPRASLTPPAQTPRVWPVGYLVKGDRVIVVMSDGTRLTEKDSELQRVERNSVLIKGEKFFIRPRAESPATGAVARQGDSRGITPAPSASSSLQQQARDEGAWVRGPDGVARLKEPVALTGLR